jgi:hypothetical protein
MEMRWGERHCAFHPFFNSELSDLAFPFLSPLCVSVPLW